MLIDLTGKTKKDVIELFDSMAIDSHHVEVNIGDEVTKYSFLNELNGKQVDYVLPDDILIGSAFTFALLNASQTATNEKWDNRLYLKIDTETTEVLKLFWDTSMPKNKRDELLLNAMRDVEVFPFEEQEAEYELVRTPVSLYHFCHDKDILLKLFWDTSMPKNKRDELLLNAMRDVEVFPFEEQEAEYELVRTPVSLYHFCHDKDILYELGKYHRGYVSLYEYKTDTEEELKEAKKSIKDQNDTIKSLEYRISELENLVSDLQYEKQELEERNEQLSDEIGELAPSGKRFRR